MANLTNSATINNYNYNITTCQTANKTSNTVTTTINVVAASVTFTKTNNPQYIDIGGASTITYVIRNNNAENITSATIVDPIFSLPGVSTSNIQNATLTGNTLKVSLGSGLAQNNSITVAIKVNVAGTAVPSNTNYDTTATGSFTIATSPVTVVTQTSKGHLEVNSAVIVLAKKLSPNVSSITAGNLLTYTITATNTGNVAATVPIGQFVDSWTANGLTNVQTSVPGFVISKNSISNSSVITINPGSSFVLTYTGNAAVPN